MLWGSEESTLCQFLRPLCIQDNFISVKAGIPCVHATFSPKTLKKRKISRSCGFKTRA